MNSSVINKALSNAVPLAIGAVIILGAVYWLSKKTVKDAAAGVGGVFTGKNAVTEGTPYEGAGVLGTLGAATNKILGGVPQAIGEGISSWFTPNVQPTGNLFYVIVFPDGSRHSIVDSAVDKNGYFTYQGKRYRLGVSRDNTRIAVAA